MEDTRTEGREVTITGSPELDHANTEAMEVETPSLSHRSEKRKADNTILGDYVETECKMSAANVEDESKQTQTTTEGWGEEQDSEHTTGDTDSESEMLEQGGNSNRNNYNFNSHENLTTENKNRTYLNQGTSSVLIHGTTRGTIRKVQENQRVHSPATKIVQHKDGADGDGGSEGNPKPEHAGENRELNTGRMPPTNEPMTVSA